MMHARKCVMYRGRGTGQCSLGKVTSHVCNARESEWPVTLLNASHVRYPWRKIGRFEQSNSFAATDKHRDVRIREGERETESEIGRGRDWT